MCLAVPGKVVEILGEGELRMGQVDFGGVRREACLAYVPEAQLGDYVLVHVGFAIARVDEEQAQETLRALEQIGALAELEAPDSGGGAAADESAQDAPPGARPGGVHDA